MDIILVLLLFLAATYLGHLIYNNRRVYTAYSITGNTFSILYGKRSINVELNDGIRIPSYSKKRDIETIVVPRRVGNMEQIEHFMIRYKTSNLADALFRFGDCSHLHIVRFDPVQAKALIDIKLKLRCFIKSI